MNRMPFGIKKFIGGREKFLGKTFIPENFMRGLDGCVIHYREGAYKHFFAYAQGNAFCIDEDAWDFAVAQGAQWLAAWITDREMFVFVDAATVNVSDVVNMGEGRQYRVVNAEVSCWTRAEGARRPPRIPHIPDEEVIDLDVWRNQPLAQ
jgi:hypothetical protein